MIVQVDPGELRLPPSRRGGADPFKLADQIRRFGDRTDDMMPVQVTLCGDGEMMINDGVTRASRIAKLRPDNSRGGHRASADLVACPPSPREGDVMTPSTAYRIAVALEELSKLYPQWRFGQLVANVATWAAGPSEQAVWDVDDEQFLRAAEQHLQARSTTAQAG